MKWTMKTESPFVSENNRKGIGIDQMDGNGKAEVKKLYSRISNENHAVAKNGMNDNQEGVRYAYTPRQKEYNGQLQTDICNLNVIHCRDVLSLSAADSFR